MTEAYSSFDAGGFLNGYTSTEGTPTDPSCGSSTTALEDPESDRLWIFSDPRSNAFSPVRSDPFFTDTSMTMTGEATSPGEAYCDTNDVRTVTTEEQPSNTEPTNEITGGSTAFVDDSPNEKTYKPSEEIPESPTSEHESHPAQEENSNSPAQRAISEEHSNASVQEVDHEENIVPTSLPTSIPHRSHQDRPSMPPHAYSTPDIYHSSTTPRRPSTLRHSTNQGDVHSTSNGLLQHATFSPQATGMQYMSHQGSAQGSASYPTRMPNLAIPYIPQEWQLAESQKFVKGATFQQQQANALRTDTFGAYPARVGNQISRFTSHGSTPQFTNTINNDNMNSQQTFLRNSHTGYMNRTMENSLSGPSTPSNSAILAPFMSSPYPYHSSLVNPYSTQQMPGTQSSSEDESIESLKHHMYGLSDYDKRPLSQQDKEWIENLKAAMCDMRRATDNEGMKRTWSGLMKQTSRLDRTCKSLLYVCRKADNSDTPLQPQVKPINHFATMEERINHICESLREQKTMCKHLMEFPYIFQVVDDPIQAAHRITNNRRVNKQKREAIELGRKHQVIEGSGRNRRRVKSESEDDDGGIDYDNEDDAEGYPESELASTPRRQQVRRSPALNRIVRRSDSEECKPPKKRRNQSRSIYQVNAAGEMVDTTSMPTSAPRTSGQPNVYQGYTQQGYYPPGYGVRRLGEYGQPSTPSDADDDGDDDGEWQPTEQPGEKRARRGNGY